MIITINILMNSMNFILANPGVYTRASGFTNWILTNMNITLPQSVSINSTTSTTSATTKTTKTATTTVTTTTTNRG